MALLDKRLESFIAVAQYGSFAAAARELYCSQPALSKQVAQLERELGVELFDRSGYRPQLTEAGRYLYHEALALKRREQRALRQLSTYVRSTVRIGFTGSYENRAILAALQDIKRQNDQLDIEFSKCTFEESVVRLVDEQVDLCFGIESTFAEVKGIVCRPLFPHRICLICSFDHPLAAAGEVEVGQIRDEPFIVLSRAFGSQFYRDFMRACKQDGFTPHIKKEVDLFDELVFAVSIGEGVAIVSEEVVRQSEVHTARLVGSHHQSTYVLAYRAESASPAVLAVADEVCARFAAGAQEAPGEPAAEADDAHPDASCAL